LMDEVAGVLSDPGVRESLTTTAAGAVTGNWTGTLWGLGGIVAAVYAYRKLRRTEEK